MSYPMQSLALELTIVVLTFNQKANIDETYFNIFECRKKTAHE